MLNLVVLIPKPPSWGKPDDNEFINTAYRDSYGLDVHDIVHDVLNNMGEESTHNSVLENAMEIAEDYWFNLKPREQSPTLIRDITKLITTVVEYLHRYMTSISREYNVISLESLIAISDDTYKAQFLVGRRIPKA